MKITALRYQVKNPERVSIYVDDKYSFSLHVDQLLSESLRVGLELDPGRLEKLKDLSIFGKVRAKALNWAMLRPRSSRELTDYLGRQLYKKLEKPDIKQVTNLITGEFLDKAWVDDTAFARWWLDRASSAKKSRRKLQSELISKGISSEMIGRLMNDDDSEALKRVIQKVADKPKYQDRQKLMRYLAGQGFSYSSIVEALDGETGSSGV